MADEIRNGGSRRDLRSIRASMRSKGLFGSIVTPRSNFSLPVVGYDIGVPTFPDPAIRLGCVQIVAHRVRSVVTSLEKPRRSLVDLLETRPSVGAGLRLKRMGDSRPGKASPQNEPSAYAIASIAVRRAIGRAEFDLPLVMVALICSLVLA